MDWRVADTLLATLFGVTLLLLGERASASSRTPLAKLAWYPVMPLAGTIVLIGVVRWITGMETLFPLAIVLLLIVVALLPDRFGAAQSAAILRHRWAPAAFGLLTGIFFLWVWGGSLRPVAPVHDEASYLLGAGLLAQGKWTAASPPLPQFFEQLNVLVVPVYASKYFPGQALTLAPGVAMGTPALMPLIALAVTGALLFALARELAGAGVALMAWLLWLTAPINPWFRPSFLSEVTTSALWLAGWWALLRWWKDRREAWLWTFALCLGWGALTRPLTMLLFAIPSGAAVLVAVVKRRAWAAFARAATLGALILLVIPIWSHSTTGRWTRTPLSVYTRMYMPYDLSLFQRPAGPATRPLPPDLDGINRHLEATHDAHAREPRWTTLTERSWAIGKDMWKGWRWVLLPAAALGLILARREILFAVGTSILLVLGYLPYWHGNSWTLYYLELQPVLAFLTASGLGALFGALSSERREGRFRRVRPESLRLVRGCALVAIGFAVFAWPDVARSRLDKDSEGAVQARFQQAIESIRNRPAIVFIRYSPGHNGHRSLIANAPPLESSPVWTVYDKGRENARLLDVARHRAPYLYDESSRALRPLELGSDGELWNSTNVPRETPSRDAPRTLH